MKRSIRSPFAIIVVIACALVVTLSIFDFTLLRSPQIGSIPITPQVAGNILKDPVILTVVNQDGGMVCSTDKYLRLRVYSSGRIEADSFDDSRFCHRKKKTALLDDLRLANLRRALDRRDLLMCKNEYPQFAVSTDSYTDSVMSFKIGQEEKTIRLTNPEWNDPMNIANYPKALIALLRQIDEIREHFEFR